MQLKEVLNLRALNQIHKIEVNLSPNNATITIGLGYNGFTGYHSLQITNSNGIMIKYKSINTLYKVLLLIENQPFYPGIESADNLQVYPQILCL